MRKNQCRLGAFTAAHLRKQLSYDPLTGEFERLTPGTNKFGPKCKLGPIRGTRSNGYLCIGVDGAPYGAHVLAFVYMTGRWPDVMVDHVNGTRNDNRWRNLREATRAQNGWNAKLQTRKKVPYKGVYFVRGAYVARISANGKRRCIGGRFKTAEEAYEAWKKAAAEIHGEFANHG